MVSADKQDGGANPSLADLQTILTDLNRADPQTYVRIRQELFNAVLSGKQEKVVDYERLKSAVAEECEANTGIPYEDAARKSKDVIASFLGLLETGEEELLDVEKALDGIADERITPDVKKKCSDLIRRTITLQRRARKNPLAFWAYVGRNDDPNHAGEVFEFGDCHVRMFETWNDANSLHSLVEAPPGHGKSTNLRGQMAWEMGDSPELRHLYITDEASKARETGLTMKRILRSRRFHAIFPDVRLLGREDQATDSSMRFTVARKNTLARDATFLSTGAKSLIQGNRFDRIWADDLCSERVKDYPAERRDLNERWSTVIVARLADPVASRIRMVCTPWHPDDVPGRIQTAVSEGRLKNWRVEIDAFRIQDDPKTGRPVPIWDKWGSDWFEDRLAENPINYDRQFRLQATSALKRSVKNVRFYNSDPTNPVSSESDRRLTQAMEVGEWFLSIDPSASANEQSSDTGVIEAVLAKARDGMEYGLIADCWFLHLGPVAMQDWIVERIYSRHESGRPYRAVLIEAQAGMVGMVSLWVHTIRQRLVEKGVKAIPDFITPGTRVKGSGQGVAQNRGKMARLVESAGYLESGIVRFAGRKIFDRAAQRPRMEPVPGSQVGLLTEHILHFDGTNRSDGVDATTQWILYYRDRMANPNRRVDAPAPEPKRLDPLIRLLQADIKSLVDPPRQDAFAEEDQFFSERRIA